MPVLPRPLVAAVQGWPLSAVVPLLTSLRAFPPYVVYVDDLSFAPAPLTSGGEILKRVVSVRFRPLAYKKACKKESRCRPLLSDGP